MESKRSRSRSNEKDPIARATKRAEELNKKKHQQRRGIATKRRQSAEKSGSESSEESDYDSVP